jgi:hypothetical protein
MFDQLSAEIRVLVRVLAGKNAQSVSFAPFIFPANDHPQNRTKEKPKSVSGR